MSTFVRILGMGLISAVIALLLKKQTAASFFVPLFGLSAILLLIVGEYGEIFTTLLSALGDSGFGRYGTLMVKSFGVGLVTQFAGNICRDFGEENLASSIELAGKAEILLLCLPLTTEVLTLLREILS